MIPAMIRIFIGERTIFSINDANKIIIICRGVELDPTYHQLQKSTEK
jgi:hypothetical protein